MKKLISFEHQIRNFEKQDEPRRRLMRNRRTIVGQEKAILKSADRKRPSYSYRKTPQIAKNHNASIIPKLGFIKRRLYLFDWEFLQYGRQAEEEKESRRNRKGTEWALEGNKY